VAQSPWLQLLLLLLLLLLGNTSQLLGGGVHTSDAWYECYAAAASIKRERLWRILLFDDGSKQEVTQRHYFKGLS